MSVNIQIQGIANTQRFLSSKNKEALQLANEAIKKAGFFIEVELVASITGERAEHRSVDTGNFRRSILAIFPKPMTANIGCNKYPVAYVNFLEYGTSTFTGRKHFMNTKTRNEKKVKDFVDAEIKKI